MTKSIKISNEECIQAYKAFKTEGFTKEFLAQRYGVTAGTLADIFAGRKRKYLGLKPIPPKECRQPMIASEAKKTINMWNDGYSQTYIARDLKFSRTTIRRVLLGVKFPELQPLIERQVGSPKTKKRRKLSDKNLVYIHGIPHLPNRYGVLEPTNG